MSMKAYGEGTMLMLAEVVQRIGCAAEMPKDHKNDWLQNRFSLKPAGRVQIPGQKGTHLLWRAADVERAKKMWEHRRSTAGVGLVISEMKDLENRKRSELEAMARETPRWTAAGDVVPVLMQTAAMLLDQAAALLGTRKAVPA